MPHDRNNEILREGDIVHVPCIVTKISPENDYCNLTLEVIELMPPSMSKNHLHLNSKQVVKVE